MFFNSQFLFMGCAISFYPKQLKRNARNLPNPLRRTKILRPVSLSLSLSHTFKFYQHINRICVHEASVYIYYMQIYIIMGGSSSQD